MYHPTKYTPDELKAMTYDERRALETERSNRPFLHIGRVERSYGYQNISIRPVYLKESSENTDAAPDEYDYRFYGDYDYQYHSKGYDFSNLEITAQRGGSNDNHWYAFNLAYRHYRTSLDIARRVVHTLSILEKRQVAAMNATYGRDYSQNFVEFVHGVALALKAEGFVLDGKILDIGAGLEALREILK